MRALVFALSLLGAVAPARAQDPAPNATQPPPEIEAVLTTEKERLERFLSGDGYNYVALEMKLREVLSRVDALLTQAQYQAALDALAPLEALRPLDEIPHVGLLMRRVRLHGELGQFAVGTPLSLRYMLMDRIVAGDRDALSEATAIEVPFVEFEYYWLARRGLKRQTQQLHHQGERSYDVLRVIDRDGRAGTLYFDVTRLVKLRMDGIGKLKS